MTSTTLIVEVGHSGHLLVYVRAIADEAAARGDRVLLAVPDETKSSREFALNLAGYSDRTIAIPPKFDLREVERVSREVRADRVIVSHVDPYLPMLALRGYRGSGVLSALIMRDPRLEAARTLPRRLRRTAKILMCELAALRLGESLLWMRPWGYRGTRPYVVDPFFADGTIPDIDECSRALRVELQLTANRFWFVVTGAITDRKNPALILEAAARVAARDSSRPIGLALIGPLRLSSDASLGDHIGVAEASGLELRIHDRLLSNLEMNVVVRSADAIVMGYDTPYPNSTLVKARALGVRLVVAGPQPLQEFAKSLGYERVCPLDLDQLVDAMIAVQDDRAPEPDLSIASPRDFACGFFAGERL